MFSARPCIRSLSESGGLQENIPRVLPENTKAIIDTNSWRKAPVFDWLQTQGNIVDDEMYRTFNCGVGMILAVAPEAAKETISLLAELGEKAWVMGEIHESAEGEEQVLLQGC